MTFKAWVPFKKKRWGLKIQVIYILSIYTYDKIFIINIPLGTKTRIKTSLNHQIWV
jgi:hypothetical protein